MKKPLDMMPAETRNFQSSIKTLKFWSVAILVVIGVLVFRHQDAQANLANASNKMSSLERRERPVSFLKKEITELENEMTDARAYDPATEMVPHYPILTLLAAVSKAANEKVAVSELTMKEHPNGRVVALSGIGTDNFAVAQFAAQLRNLQRFNTVVLKSNLPKQINQQNARQFLIECEY